MGKKAVSREAYRTHCHVSMDEPGSAGELADCLAGHIRERVTDEDIVLVCIGTDRSTGDSLGPLTGSKLLEKQLENFYIYGTLQYPVHAVNLEETLSIIAAEHPHAFIIAVDACLGYLQNVGKVTLNEGGVTPGAAMKKQLPMVGDMHINGIVNVSGMMEYFVLQNTRLYTIDTMASLIADSFLLADRSISKQHVLQEEEATTPPVTFHNEDDHVRFLREASSADQTDNKHKKSHHRYRRK
ncbi:spore protease YyaC [Marinococcus luteus]|uniref:spore protease YyaC n=1 Tax=Marinococcus luteus TaxID=1122204 RepID=UPI002ACD1598|nr:spore protease YyaC [Marinococcus luteus]MDZ5782522.1 spore protease YyaC [Marinococcus luteus]